MSRLTPWVAILLGLALNVRAGEVSVAVAANFNAPMRKIAQLFEQETGHRAVLSSGSTGGLHVQIRHGAPFQVLVAADASTPLKIENEGLGVAGSRFTCAIGRLVLWSLQPGFVDGQGDVLRRGEFERLAIANPKLAPYGVAALETLSRLGVLQRVQPRLVRGENISQTYQFVATGNAELGLVALSQVVADGKIVRGSGWIIPTDLHAPMRQDAILLNPGKVHPAAIALMGFLRGDKARAVIRSFGYDLWGRRHRLRAMNEFHDLAIVGAGVSGLYSAWRVLEDASAGDHALKLTVFESGDRVGGRLLSVKPPFVNDTLVELGGMRFSESHRLTHDLTVALGLESRELADANPDNIAYLRGQRIRKGELINPERLPYVIDESLRNPESLQNLLAVAAVRALGPAFQQVLGFDLTLETLKHVSVEQWRAVGERGLFEGKPLYETPLHYLLERTLGHGAVQLLQDSLGYDCILWTWSAADGFPWNLADFCGGVSHRHLTEGFAALPMRLADRVVARGGDVRLHTTLKAIDSHVLPDGTSGVCFTTCDRAGVETTHLARKLILAMPRRAIELLDKKGALFDEPAAGFKALLQSVSPIPLFKIALCYETCWWERVVGPGSHGKSVTDLPMRQVYYWKVNPQDSQGVVLIYDGGLVKSYWEQLDHAEGPRKQVQTAARRPGVPLWADFAAPSRVIFEAHRQLLELHGLGPDEVPAPYSAACMSWSRDPYGGGAHFWNMGVRSHEVAEKILHPVARLPVYICGECWSHDQGWVEGALATAETMLQRYFSLPAVHDTGLI